MAPILGPRLDGGAFAVVRDTDGGAYDGDAAYDRAVGPMQFIPSTWARWGTDGNGDGRADPDNVFDAALAAGRYLCAGGRDLSDPAELDRAVLGYNHSEAYLRTVRARYAYFLEGYRVAGQLREVLGAPGAVAAAVHAEALADTVRPSERRPLPDTVRTSLSDPRHVPSGGRGHSDGEAPTPLARRGHRTARRRPAAQRRSADH
ncbi:lytic transglycosylase domain-containing protein [Streptomyces sp. NPDC059837]|uniref:lytic transglycosylase domain-containing protein n=1 Tax=Streptomyces sp. NPDC059837 TaxID=3346968 RepID=UPI003665BFC6